MKVSELAGLIGREGVIRMSKGFTARVRVLDARMNYGKLQYLVTSASGEGKAWVEARRVAFDEETER